MNDTSPVVTETTSQQEAFASQPGVCVIRPSAGNAKSFRGWSGRVLAACLATGLAMGLAAYAVWKPSTTAADLVFLPGVLVRWLDEHGDLRTMVMAIAVSAAPAVLLAPAE